MKYSYNFIASVIFIVFILGCSAPREITLSGKVTPSRQLRGGGNFSGNIPTQTISSLYGNIEDIANTLINQDTIMLDTQLLGINKSLIAYAIDPLSTGMSFYVRYGVIKHFDIGYKYASGTHVFDAMFQFLGSTKAIDSVKSDKKNMYGSIGVQYSTQKYDLPSMLGLDKVQEMLGFELSRKDILVPLIFSNSIGNDEEYGSISYGLVYGHSFVSYGFHPQNIYEPLDSVISQYTQNIGDKQNFSAYGAFLNLKVGYQYAYLILSLSTYHQNYGSYKLLNGESVDLSGWTFIPTIGLQFNVPLNKLGKSKKSSQVIR